MKFARLLSEYRWPIFVGGLLSMSVVSSGVLVWVATRPDAPRPMQGYFEAALAWDVTEAERIASQELGWTVRYELPSDVPSMRGMPRPVDVTVADRNGAPVVDLTGRLFAIRPSDTRLNQTGTLSAIPDQPGRYRTIVRLDEAGEWEMRLDANQQSLRFVHAARMQVAR
jgi:nitrogen fixation protein FixH